MQELEGTRVGESSPRVEGAVLSFGDNFGVRGGEMGRTPEVGEPATPHSLSVSVPVLFLRGDGEALLVLLPGGGRIRLSSSS